MGEGKWPRISRPKTSGTPPNPPLLKRLMGKARTPRRHLAPAQIHPACLSIPRERPLKQHPPVPLRRSGHRGQSLNVLQAHRLRIHLPRRKTLRHTVAQRDTGPRRLGSAGHKHHACDACHGMHRMHDAVHDPTPVPSHPRPITNTPSNGSPSGKPGSEG